MKNSLILSTIACLSLAGSIPALENSSHLIWQSGTIFFHEKHAYFNQIQYSTDDASAGLYRITGSGLSRTGFFGNYHYHNASLDFNAGTKDKSHGAGLLLSNGGFSPGLPSLPVKRPLGSSLKLRRGPLELGAAYYRKKVHVTEKEQTRATLAKLYSGLFFESNVFEFRFGGSMNSIESVAQQQAGAIESHVNHGATGVQLPASLLSLKTGGIASLAVDAGLEFEYSGQGSYAANAYYRSNNVFLKLHTWDVSQSRETEKLLSLEAYRNYDHGTGFQFNNRKIQSSYSYETNNAGDDNSITRSNDLSQRIKLRFNTYNKNHSGWLPSFYAYRKFHENPQVAVSNLYSMFWHGNRDSFHLLVSIYGTENNSGKGASIGAGFKRYFGFSLFHYKNNSSQWVPVDPVFLSDKLYHDNLKEDQMLYRPDSYTGFAAVVRIKQFSAYVVALKPQELSRPQRVSSYEQPRNFIMTRFQAMWRY